MTMQGDPRSTVRLVADMFAHLGGMMRGEVALAKAELRENLHAARRGVALLAGAAVLAVVALNVLTGALIAALSAAGLHPGWAALLVGLAIAVVALVLARTGAAALDPGNLAPRRTASNLKRDAETLKEAIS